MERSRNARACPKENATKRVCFVAKKDRWRNLQFRPAKQRPLRTAEFVPTGSRRLYQKLWRMPRSTPVDESFAAVVAPLSPSDAPPEFFKRANVPYGGLQICNLAVSGQSAHATQNAKDRLGFCKSKGRI